RDEISLPLSFLRPRPQVPLHRIGADAEGGQELEILILDVLNGVRRNLSVCEQPVHVTRPRTVESKLDCRGCQRGDYSGFEVNLEVDNQIEMSLCQRFANIGEGAQSARPVEDDDVIYRMVAANQRRGSRLKLPGYPRRGVRALESIDDREHVHR